MSNMLYLLMFIVFLLASVWTPLHAGNFEQSVNRIDLNMQQCLDKSSGYLYDQKPCILEAEKEWDKILNISYKSLMNTLNAEQKEVVRQAQRDWIRYRDSQISAIQAIYDGDWEIAELERATYQMKLTKQKALELREYERGRITGHYSN